MDTHHLTRAVLWADQLASLAKCEACICTPQYNQMAHVTAELCLAVLYEAVVPGPSFMGLANLAPHSSLHPISSLRSFDVDSKVQTFGHEHQAHSWASQIARLLARSFFLSSYLVTSSLVFFIFALICSFIYMFFHMYA